MKNVIIIGLIIGYIACAPSNEQKIETLKNEIMALHDEVMPKMSELVNVEKEINDLKKNNIDGDTMQYVMVIEEVRSANMNMMDWMRNYNSQMEGSEEEKMAYYEAEKLKINKVNTDVKNALMSGNEFIK